MLSTSHLDDEFTSLKRIARQDGKPVAEVILHHYLQLSDNGARPEYCMVILREMVKRMDAEAAQTWRLPEPGEQLPPDMDPATSHLHQHPKGGWVGHDHDSGQAQHRHDEDT